MNPAPNAGAKYSADVEAKHLRDADDLLTHQLKREIESDMRRRYRSVWHLDDAFFDPHECVHYCTTKKNNMRSTEHPIAPWGLIFAYLTVAASLLLLFVIVATGGIDLG